VFYVTDYKHQLFLFPLDFPFLAFCFSYPDKDDKLRLASAIVTAMPGLKDSAGITGFVSVSIFSVHTTGFG